MFLQNLLNGQVRWKDMALDCVKIHPYRPMGSKVSHKIQNEMVRFLKIMLRKTFIV